MASDHSALFKRHLGMGSAHSALFKRHLGMWSAHCALLEWHLGMNDALFGARGDTVGCPYKDCVRASH